MAFTEENAARRTVRIPRVLLPKDADMYAWAVNACDQFTSNTDYWREVEKIAEGKLSTYHLIFPEIYLKDDPDGRIAQINANMRAYLKDGVFKELDGGFILVERTTQSGTRTGIVLAIDLECYSFVPEDSALIRSTEATVLDRLPPRVKIRKDAPLELPHVMLLYNDPKSSVLSSAERGEVLYDFDLNMGGGHVKGTYIKNSQSVIGAFSSLLPKGAEKEGGMLFAVGDGNHSLAAAKLCWESIKSGLTQEQQAVHPARFALCEAVNIYDGALGFHPIHRFVKTAAPERFIRGWNIKGDGAAVAVSRKERSELPFPSDIPQGIRLLDEYIASFIKEYGGEVDYIHGEADLVELTGEGVGILLPAIEKGDFFPLIERGGNLPKKTFSMGEGSEKRYYIEAKKIK